MDFHLLAKQYQTPLYIYNFDQIKANFLAFKEAFAGRKSLICYALKANSNLSLLGMLAKLGSGADCVSIGEIRRAILSGIPRYKIIFSGVGKQDSEIKEALQEEILFLNLESKQEMMRVEKIAQELGKIARVSIRVNPNINPKTHPFISTGLYENKFGVQIEEAKEMYLYIRQSLYLQAVGIHFHIGSQLINLDPISQASQKVVDLLDLLLTWGLEIKFFDIGGGLGIRYVDEEPINLNEYAQSILSTLKNYEPTIICEPGRRIVGDAGVLLTQVIAEKSNAHKRFVIVDAAMNDLMRPSLYGATHQARLISHSQSLESLCDIVGPICESGDYLAKNISFPMTQPQDLIIFENAGAYGYSMSSNYNSRMRAAEVAFQDGEYRLIRARENFEEMLKNEMDYLQ